MKILYIIDKPDLYGSGRHLLDLIFYFSEMYDVKVVYFKNGGLIEIFNENQINHELLELKWTLSFYRIWLVYLAVKQFKPDIIHNHQPKATFYGALIGSILRLNVVNTIHSRPDQNSFIKKTFAGKIATYYFHKMIQFVSEKSARKNIFVSYDGLKESFCIKKAKVVYNWLSEEKSTSLNYVKQKNYGVYLQRILSVGSITYGKGFDLLLEFVRKTQHIPYHFDILGEGDSFLVNELSKFENIQLHGFIKDPTEFYRNSNMFILFSRSETFGLSYIEAASNGLPVFALDLPVVKEILPNNNFFSRDVAFHVKSFEHLFYNPKIQKEIGLKNFMFVQNKFKFSGSVKEIDDIYNKVLRHFGA